MDFLQSGTDLHPSCFVSDMESGQQRRGEEGEGKGYIGAGRTFILIPVNICAIEGGDTRFNCPHNLSQSASVIYAHICARNDEPHFRPHEVWRAMSPSPNLWDGLCHFVAEASFEVT